MGAVEIIVNRISELDNEYQDLHKQIDIKNKNLMDGKFDSMLIEMTKISLQMTKIATLKFELQSILSKITAQTS